MTITFDEARVIGGTSQSVRDWFGEYVVADYGWENADVYVLAYDPVDPEVVLFDAPALLVDKRTGRLREVFGLVGNVPAPGLVPVGPNPNPRFQTGRGEQPPGSGQSRRGHRATPG